MQGARLAILPELFAVPYITSDEPSRWRHIAETVDGPTSRAIAATAQRLKIWILFGLALCEGPGNPLNAALLACPDGALRKMAEKVNLPPAPAGAFGEADHFRAGRPDFPPIDIEGVRVSAIICFDRRYPECWRARMEAGADVVAVLVAGPAPGDPPGVFEAELRCHARANALFVAAAARFGVEDVLSYPVAHDGVTLAIDADGALMAQTGEPEGCVLLIIHDLALARARTNRASRTTGRFAYEFQTQGRTQCAN